MNRRKTSVDLLSDKLISENFVLCVFKNVFEPKRNHTLEGKWWEKQRRGFPDESLFISLLILKARTFFSLLGVPVKMLNMNVYINLPSNLFFNCGGECRMHLLTCPFILSSLVWFSSLKSLNKYIQWPLLNSRGIHWNRAMFISPSLSLIAKWDTISQLSVN